MAGRGRGGRGGWRGRGARGTGAAGQQRLTDEDGTVLDLEEGGPPKLFPDIELPPKLEVGAEDKKLLLHYRESLRQFQSGPYFTRRPTDRQRGFEDEITDGSGVPGRAGGSGGARGGAAAAGGAAGGSGDGQPALALMTLDPRYFPEELWTEKDKRQAARSARAASFRGATPAPGPDGEGPPPPDGAGLADYLARRAAAEAAAAAGGAAGAAGGADAGAEDEEGAVVDEHDSDSEVDDDYHQGEHFDDDDEYDEDDGGGGDDAYY